MAGSNPYDEFFVPPAYDFRTTPVPMYEDMNFKIRQNTEDDESDETTNIFDKTKDFLGSNKQAIGGGVLASLLGLGPLGILLGGFLGRRRDQGGGIFESARARDKRIAQETIAANFRQKQMEKEAQRQLSNRETGSITSGSGQTIDPGDLSVGFDQDTGQAFSEYSSPGTAASYEGSFAGGGIASLQPRQGYFAGKLVKAVTKPFKKAAKALTKVAKSDLGKAALTGAAIYGLGGGFKGDFAFSKIPFIGGIDFSGIPGGGVTAGIVGASLLGGLLTSKQPEQDINALSQRISDQTGIDVAKIRGEVQQAYQNKDTSSLAQKYPFLVNQEYSASFAKGGRTGFAEGTPKDEVIEERGLPTLKTMPEFKGDEVKPADMMMAGYGYNEAMSDTFDMYNDMKKNGLIPPTMSFDEFLQEVVPEMSRKKDTSGMMASAILGDESDDIAQQLFGKPVKELNSDEFKELMDYLDDLQKSFRAEGGRIGVQEGGLMNLGGNEMDLRGGGFVPIGAREKADDVPARLSKNEFVFTADAVRAAGGGSVDRGADLMYKTMKQLENKVV